MRAAWYERQGNARDVLRVEIAERFPLDGIVTAHERVEAPQRRGRVIVLP